MQNKHRKCSYDCKSWNRQRQLNARRGAERALVEAQTRITQLDQALQQGGRPGTAAGQVVDTRVFGRPDKWDGSEKAWSNWSFVMKAYAEAIDQALSADMTTAECSTDAMSNDTMTGETKARSVQLYFVLIMLCTGSALDRIANAPHGWGMEAWRMLFQAYSPKNNARLVVMMLEVLAFPLHTNDVVDSLETMERKIKEFERYANIEIPEFLKIGIVIRQAEEGPMRTHLIMNSHRLATFQDIKTEVTDVKQAQSAVKARSGDAMDVDAFTKGSKGASKGSCNKQDSEVVCWYCDRKGHRASDCRKKQRDNDSGKSKDSKQCSCRKKVTDLGARKIQVKLRDGSLRYVNPRVADTHRELMAESEMNDMGHDVFFSRSVRGICAYAYHESSGAKLELERVNGVFELPPELVPYSQSTLKNSTSGSYSSLSALEQIKDMMLRVMIVDHPS